MGHRPLVGRAQQLGTGEEEGEIESLYGLRMWLWRWRWWKECGWGRDRRHENVDVEVCEGGCGM